MIVYNDFNKEKWSYRLWIYSNRFINDSVTFSAHRAEGPACASWNGNEEVFCVYYLVWGRLHNAKGLATHSDFLNSWCIHGVEVTDIYDTI